MRSEPTHAQRGAEGVVDRIVATDRQTMILDIDREREGAGDAISSASASARPAARPRQGNRHRRAEPRLAGLSAARRDRRTGSACPVDARQRRELRDRGRMVAGAARGATQRDRHHDRHRHRRRPDPRRRAVSRLVATSPARSATPPSISPAATASAATTAASRRTRAARRSPCARAKCSCARKESLLRDDGGRQARRSSPPRPSTRRRSRATRSRSEIVRDTARFLGAGIANLLNILNPDVVVVAGGVDAGRRRAVRAAPRRGASAARSGRRCAACRIVPGELAGTAGVVGAVATFKQQHLGAREATASGFRSAEE